MKNPMFYFLGLLIFASCTSTPKVLPEGLLTLDAKESMEVRAQAQVGLDFTVSAGQLESAFGGRLSYNLFKPKKPLPGVPVILLAHGFLRTMENMRGWAERLSSLGWTVALPTLIHSSLLGGNHDKNAGDLRALADKEFPGQGRIYGGFSAGGLAAVIAASGDPGTRGIFGLDAVDSGGLGFGALEVLKGRSLPGIFLFGDPSGCNAQNNFLPAFKTHPESWAVESVEGATHPVFEYPYDPQVEGFCGSYLDPRGPDVLGARIRAKILGWLSTFSPLP